MATKKSTTQAKTKTTKSRAAKSAPAKTTVKKTTTKVPLKNSKATKVTTKKTVKTVKVVAAEKKVSSQSDGFSKLRRWHLISAVAFLALSVAAGLLMQTTTYLLSLGHLGRDSLASRTETVYAPAMEPFHDLEIRWALVAMLGIAALFSILYLTRLAGTYRRSVDAGGFRWRWAETAITSAIMVGLIAVLSGVDEIGTLKLISGTTIIMAALAWLTERDHAAVRPNRSTFMLSIFAAALPWVVIGIHAISTFIYGGIRYGWYVYALYAVSILSGLYIIRNLSRSINNRQPSYVVTERNYVVASFLTKVAFAVILIVGLQK